MKKHKNNKLRDHIAKGKMPPKSKGSSDPAKENIVVNQDQPNMNAQEILAAPRGKK